MNIISSAFGLAADLRARGVAYAEEIAGAAALNHLDPRLLAAVAAQETGGPGSNAGRNVMGDGGHGHGLFQINDRFHAFARSADAMNPQANANYAARMLSGLLRAFHGDVHKALSAYNAGDPNARGTVTEWQDGEQLGYADSVLRHYNALGATPTFNPLLDALTAESQTEQTNVNALSSFAALQPPAMPQQQPYSYRQMAGLDDSGRTKNGDPLVSMLDVDDQ
jgi:hypothetical protein